jgi:transcriptional regulator with XRE-family HTH domain
MNKKTLGEQIAALRKEKKMSQKEFAKLFNSTQQHISLIEKNKMNCTLETINRIADILGYTYEVVFTKKIE